MAKSKVAVTPFLKLSNWVGSDTPQRVDFVGDNIKIDNFAKEIKQETLNLQLEKANALDVERFMEEVKREKANKTDIPKKTSELTNDSGFVTQKDIDSIDLTYLEKEIEFLTKAKAGKVYVDAELAGKSHIGHTHTQYAEKTLLKLELLGKSDLNHTHPQYATREQFDTLKQSGEESNKILVDNLLSKGVSASTRDSIRDNATKVQSIQQGVTSVISEVFLLTPKEPSGKKTITIPQSSRVNHLTTTYSWYHMEDGTPSTASFAYSGTTSVQSPFLKATKKSNGDVDVEFERDPEFYPKSVFCWLHISTISK